MTLSLEVLEVSILNGFRKKQSLREGKLDVCVRDVVGATMMIDTFSADWSDLWKANYQAHTVPCSPVKTGQEPVSETSYMCRCKRVFPPGAKQTPSLAMK